MRFTPRVVIKLAGSVSRFGSTPSSDRNPSQCGASNLSTGPVPVFLGPLTFTAVGSPNYLQAISPLLNPGRDCLGGNVGLQTEASVDTAFENSDASLVIGLPRNTDAFGINLNNVDAESTGIFIMTITLGNSQLDSFAVSAPLLSSTFLGFVSSSPVTQVDITEIATNGLGPLTMESP